MKCENDKLPIGNPLNRKGLSSRDAPACDRDATHRADGCWDVYLCPAHIRGVAKHEDNKTIIRRLSASERSR